MMLIAKIAIAFSALVSRGSSGLSQPFDSLSKSVEKLFHKFLNIDKTLTLLSNPVTIPINPTNCHSWNIREYAANDVKQNLTVFAS